MVSASTAHKDNKMTDCAPPLEAEATSNTSLEDLRKLVDRIIKSDDKHTRLEIFKKVKALELIDELGALDGYDIVAMTQTLESLAAVRGFRVRVNQMLSSVRRARKRAASEKADRIAEQLTRQASLSDCLPEYLSSKVGDFIVPKGYELTQDGVSTLSVSGDDLKRTKFMNAPFIIASRGRDMSNGSLQMVAAWVEHNQDARPKWRSRAVTRSELMDTKQLISLCNFGAPVSSINLGQVVRWLSEFESANERRLPLINGTSHMGWQNDNSFVFTDVHVQKDNDAPQLKLFAPIGYGHLKAGWGTEGTWEGWLQAAEIAKEHPVLMLGIYAAVASIMLHPLQAPNFIMDISGETSTGKTTALKVAASAVGKPTEGCGGVIHSWDATKVGIERSSGYLRSLPMFMDETKRSDKDTISSIIYDYTSGRGRERGSKAGLAQTMSWNSCMISTGEQRLSSFTKNAGTRARILCVEDKPIMGDPETGRVIADRLTAIVTNNYGHLGRRVASYLVSIEDQWGELRTAYLERKQDFSCAAVGSVGGRLAGYVAIIDIAMAVCNAVGVPEPACDPIQVLINTIRLGSYDADQPREAMFSAITWAVQHEDKFVGSERYSRKPVHNLKALGKWNTIADNWLYLYIIKDELSNFLVSKGYVPDEIYKRWKDRGWIETMQRRFDVGVSLYHANRPARCIAIRRGAVDAVNISSEEMTRRSTVPEVEDESVLDVKSQDMDLMVPDSADEEIEYEYDPTLDQALGTDDIVGRLRNANRIDPTVDDFNMDDSYDPTAEDEY